MANVGERFGHIGIRISQNNVTSKVPLGSDICTNAKRLPRPEVRSFLPMTMPASLKRLAGFGREAGRHVGPTENFSALEAFAIGVERMARPIKPDRAEQAFLPALTTSL
jgi:hypothetical protein